MPSEENKQKRVPPSLKNMISNLNSTRNDIYKSTYYTTTQSRDDLDLVIKSVNNTIKQIMDVNIDTVGEPNIARLLERISTKNGTSVNDTTEAFQRIFGDEDALNNIASGYIENRWVQAFDSEIEEVLRYMPKLKEAVDVMRDNVLSSDSFSKEFLSIKPTIPMDNRTESQFINNIDAIKEKYDLSKLTTEIYETTATFGEQFVYCVPYDKAIQRLLDTKANTSYNAAVNTLFKENGDIIVEGGAIQANGKPKKRFVQHFDSRDYSDFKFNFTFEVDNSRIISSIVEEAKYEREESRRLFMESCSGEYMVEHNLRDKYGRIITESPDSTLRFDNSMDADIELKNKLPVHHNFDHTVYDDMPIPEEDSTPSVDGLKTTNSTKSKLSEINGCIVRKLKRSMVVPILIDSESKVCLGYRYYEIKYDDDSLFDEASTTANGAMINTITGLRSNGKAETYDAMQRREEMLRVISGQIADRIDADFINKNQDLKKEIYYILKYNDDHNSPSSISNIKLTYIPPEDIHHITFDIDERTGRGVSDLALSLIPAKLFVAIYITNCLGIMTRGNDKRVYYVRQTVEQNIAKTLLKTINEIKKGNFGIRQIENINSVLNITGKFNDYIIPRGADGQSPVEFEVMQGQQIEIKTELLNMLEEAAINVTGVPIELIQNRQSPDYAMQLTMSSSKFLRFVYNRQTIFQKQMSKLYTKIYDLEYGSTDKIELILPPPLFINMTNTNQLIQNATEYAENVIESFIPNEDDEVKAEAKSQLKRYNLSQYVDANLIDVIIDKAKHEIALRKLTLGDNEE